MPLLRLGAWPPPWLQSVPTFSRTSAVDRPPALTVPPYKPALKSTLLDSLVSFLGFWGI